MTPLKPTREALLRHVRPADLKAAVQLVTQATTGAIGVAEGVHQAVRNRLGLPAGLEPGRTGGLTGQIYQGIRGVTQLVGHGLDSALRSLAAHGGRPHAPPRALARPRGRAGRAQRRAGRPPAGNRQPAGPGHGTAPRGPAPAAGEPAAAASAAGAGHAAPDRAAARPVHERHAMATQRPRPRRLPRAGPGRHAGLPALQQRPAHLHQRPRIRAPAGSAGGAVPVPLASITLIGHSMGGLVARAACEEGRQADHRWRPLLQHLVFLGTPHQGAPLERAGHGVDVLLASTPFTAPFTRLGQLRSAGITDLRHGHVRDADWQGRERFGSSADHREPLPLPEGVACFTIAATLAPQRGLLADRLTGDGLVPLRSALGQHDDPRHRLVFARESQRTVHRTGHLELLSSPVVAEQLRAWLAPAVVEA
ncbi:alpha/beta hydrolase [Hydrogenophaga sp. UC242_53]|uniref:PGAP1-like alpha/beta domain-containing protein n=1 Tax=Hydrogenophaga sp. UC242_53 TaxID=3350170 RepID=UPI0036D289FB